MTRLYHKISHEIFENLTRNVYFMVYGIIDRASHEIFVPHHLDKWLKTVPDQPRGGGYSERVAAESNSIQHQAAIMRARR